MTPEDAEKFSEMLKLVAEQYGKPMSPDLIVLYFDGLSHLPIDVVREAFAKHLRNTETGQFMPKIADIIRACDGRIEDQAYAALVELQDAMQRHGTYASVEFADKITMAVVRDMGGWPALGQRDADDWARFGAKDFQKRYRIYKERGEVNAPQYLPGIFESNPHGTFEKPVLIGVKKESLAEQKRIAA